MTVATPPVSNAASVAHGLDHAAITALLAPLATDKHPVAPCDRCGAPVLAAKQNTPPCRITPKCDGNHQPKDTTT